MAKRTETAPEPQEAPVAASAVAPEGQEPDAAPAAEKARNVSYVVQREMTLPDIDSGGERWVDIATVEMPPRSKRKTVIGRALAESGVRPEVGGDPLRVRVLDAASAHVTTITAKQRDPELEIR